MSNMLFCMHILFTMYVYVLLYIHVTLLYRLLKNITLMLLGNCQELGTSRNTGTKPK